MGRFVAAALIAYGVAAPIGSTVYLGGGETTLSEDDLDLRDWVGCGGWKLSEMLVRRQWRALLLAERCMGPLLGAIRQRP